MDHDVLGRILEQTRLRGQVYCQTAARPPWGLRFESRDEAFFHLVTEGTCWLFSGGDRQQLVAGDLVLLPRGSAHALADNPKSRRIGLKDWLASSGKSDASGGFHLGGTDGPETRVICGMYAFDVAGPRHPVLSLLPETLYLPSHRTRDRADLAGTIASLGREYAAGARGASVVVPRLLEVLFVQIIRAWADEQPPGGAGWIGALRDTTIARALAFLHADIARAWDVETLARAVGTSRATLGRRFASEVGEPPLTYLARSRMLEAARRLAATEHGLATIANDVGYESEFAFNRAFRREFGVPPGEYRRGRLKTSQ